MILVECGSCGERWLSHAASGRTRCRACGERIYLPMWVRDQASGAPGAYVFAESQLFRAG